jgi:hypothetical protein
MFLTSKHNLSFAIFFVSILQNWPQVFREILETILRLIFDTFKIFVTSCFEFRESTIDGWNIG